ncbi:bile acid:sodium symporter family protein [Sphingosinicella rhizophila]|uniref:Bile acid:sodium symporter family protein n=1 Tax=Sphingosinicella rhizophila TaxID=3050082 RepID=A0ABU3QB17_9SPHN|nr:bile acid:sodium symporter family protein [Sphingosinicella sp. GR2756]MDT9600603.1 bile acid:sodium symporter family protein [Sphingosinicella sp. GR2756]
MSQDFIALVNTVFVPVGLMLIMFSLGLTLALRDFKLVLLNGRTVAAGLGGQMVMMPLLGLAVGSLFGLGPELALGLFIISICPAGTTSNALTFVGGGNVALAVVLTAVTSILTVFTIPLLLSWALPFFLAGGGGKVPELSILDTMKQLFTITVLPIAVGMIVHRFAPEASAKMARWLRPTSLVVLLGVIAFSVAVSLDMVLLNLVAAGPAVWTLNVVAMGCGLLIAKAIGARSRDAMTLAIEVGVQNATMAIFLTLTVLGNLELAVTQNIYGVLMILNAFLLIRWFSRRIAAERASEA